MQKVTGLLVIVYGFRPGRTWADPADLLVYLMLRWIKAIESNGMVMAISLNIAKASNRVFNRNHKYTDYLNNYCNSFLRWWNIQVVVDGSRLEHIPLAVACFKAQGYHQNCSFCILTTCCKPATLCRWQIWWHFLLGKSKYSSWTSRRETYVCNWDPLEQVSDELKCSWFSWIPKRHKIACLLKERHFVAPTFLDIP